MGHDLRSPSGNHTGRRAVFEDYLFSERASSI
jgi:hypothetical protein